MYKRQEESNKKNFEKLKEELSENSTKNLEKLKEELKEDLGKRMEEIKRDVYKRQELLNKKRSLLNCLIKL